jgi:hypothetical protein
MMGILALVNHVINFLAPAFWLALLLPLFSTIYIRKRPITLVWYAQSAIHFIVGSAVLVGNLLVFGRDGKMMTYLTLVLMAATVQWWIREKR